MPEELRYEQKLKAALKKTPVKKESTLWFAISIYSIFIFIIVALYYFVQQGTFTFRIANRAIADVGMLLIGLSMALSALCYFWDFADSFIIYRKHLGLAGFAFALGHSVLSLFFMPQLFPFPQYYLEQKNMLSFSTALVSLIIYTIMALISNRFAIQELGGKLWRNLLRIGYIAYFLTIIHFGVRGFPYWLRWLNGQSDNVFPSFGLITFVFGISVLFLRIALLIARLNTNTATINGDGKNNT